MGGTNHLLKHWNSHRRILHEADRYQIMDVRDLEIEAGSIDVAIDKVVNMTNSS